MFHPARFSTRARAIAVPLSCLALATVLAGCATAPSTDPQPAKAAPAAPAKPVAEPVQTAPAPAVLAPAQRNPVVIDFPVRSVLLTEDARDLLAQVATRAKAASAIQIMGFCDKAQAPNAREIAIGRGIAVRNELVRLGVPAAKLKVRFTTTEPRHAVDLTLEDAGATLAK